MGFISIYLYWAKCKSAPIVSNRAKFRRALLKEISIFGIFGPSLGAPTTVVKNWAKFRSAQIIKLRFSFNRVLVLDLPTFHTLEFMI